MLPVRLRARALDDLDTAATYYDEHAAHRAQAFIDAFLTAQNHIAQHPGTGSKKYATRPRLKGLRYWLLTDFPYAVFYVERATHIEIVRVLHQSADIPQHLQH
jgi:toxin ParE1/3/4